MRSIFVLLLLLINAVFGGSPTGGYAPGRVSCPKNKVTRSALEGIGADEKSYIDERYKIAKSEMTTFLKKANMSDFDVDSFMEQHNPTIGIAFAALIGLLAFVSASSKQDEVFAWLVALSGLSTFFTWGSINGAYIRYRRAMYVQGRSLDEIPYKANTGVWGAYYGLIMNIVVLGLQFWLALFPIGKKPDAVYVFKTYLAAVIVLATYLVHKVWTRNWSFLITAKDIDLDTGRRDLDVELLRQELEEEKELLRSKPWYIKMYRFWC